MRTITTRVDVYRYEELSSEAQRNALNRLREREINRSWDDADREQIEQLMVYTLAEQLQTPGWDQYGDADFPGIPLVAVFGWDLDRAQTLEVQGFLDRGNAPGLPWVDLMDQVELRAVRRSGAEIEVYTHDPDCRCPLAVWDQHQPGGCDWVQPAVTVAQKSAMEQAVRDALGAAWQAGRDTLDYQHSEEHAQDLAENIELEFTVDGYPYP